VEASSGPRGPAEPRRPAPKRRKRPSGSDALISVTPSGKQQALTIAREARGYKIYYPRLIVPRSSFSYASPRAYRICGPNGGKCYQSYRIVLSRDLIGEYYGVQGTTWKDPPILDDPSEKRTIKGRTYELHFAGDRLRLVAWRTPKAAYWISNTLLQTLTKRQMMAIARSARRCC
jgi:polyisoprenyl-teichoic acid--peptidoglycan teichoic acid transferase